ncbi:tyrosine recombinase [Corynebacterium choanae]|uniref:Tyrosine recombinase XerC n=1 Tax=Corynebacterium choanae TaxID=1862358 RepID=A0A3G6J6C6_9CORY|nr:tyrosine recombinase [Corynebacterium choanae]AZA13489.1 Tyrosine recombinase XerD [Corynebacterium choanae]
MTSSAESSTQLHQLIDLWLRHLTIERDASPHTVDSYRRDLLRYRRFLQQRNIDSLAVVTSTDCEAYLQYLATGDPASGVVPLAKSSQARAWVVARGLHRFACAEGLVNDDVAHEIQTPKPRQVFPATLTREEMEHLLAVVNDPQRPTQHRLRDRVLVEMLYSTGCRISELLQLAVDDVTGSRRTLRVTGKGMKQRLVPYGAYAQQAVADYLTAERPRWSQGLSHQLLLNERGKGLSRQSACAALKQLGEEAKLPYSLTPHTLRHTFATHLLLGGADIRSVQELLGHSSVTTTELYTHITNQQVQSMYEQHHPRAQLSLPHQNS